MVVMKWCGWAGQKTQLPPLRQLNLMTLLPPLELGRYIHSNFQSKRNGIDMFSDASTLLYSVGNLLHTLIIIYTTTEHTK